MTPADLLPKVKANLILDTDEDDALLLDIIAAAIAYAEGYQHRAAGYYATGDMPATTQQGVTMLASHLYESKDGSTGGFYADNPAAAAQAREAVHNLLKMDRDWGAAI